MRGVHVDDAKHFDLVARAFGARAYVSIAWADEGLVLTAKLKSGFFGTPAALERLLLESAHEAEARLAVGAKPKPGETV